MHTWEPTHTQGARVAGKRERERERERDGEWVGGGGVNEESMGLWGKGHRWGEGGGGANRTLLHHVQ